ncbi:hypothetical protein K1720_02795 [Thermococcus argininiproducens]|uniref:Uncharacterized protein n=1 Tax=Thermococcus argininiproducens TaxID=2866384 RepID=A0A9E7MB62_9EURY|nr:hypothetical protein [Thermococcus argininiproducens]USH00411.1 hypothetical protein K1720_02795 [Thermococcus argininiproducens]
MWKKLLALGLVLMAFGVVVGEVTNQANYAIHKYNSAKEKYHRYMELYRKALLNGNNRMADYYKSLAEEYSSEMNLYTTWISMFGAAALAGAASGNPLGLGVSVLALAGLA